MAPVRRNGAPRARRHRAKKSQRWARTVDSVSTAPPRDSFEKKATTTPEEATEGLTANYYDRLRTKMVEQQIAARGVRSARVLAAMSKVRREGYVASYLGEFAYADSPLPIEEEQTISQPYIVAFMIDALQLRGGDRVLEIGTGS